MKSSESKKKMLVLKFIAGPLVKKEIVLDPESMPIVFGMRDKNPESG